MTDVDQSYRPAGLQVHDLGYSNKVQDAIRTYSTVCTVHTVDLYIRKQYQKKPVGSGFDPIGIYR